MTRRPWTHFRHCADVTRGGSLEVRADDEPVRAREPGDVVGRDAGPDEDGERGGDGLDDAADVVGGGLGAGGGPVKQ